MSDPAWFLGPRRATEPNTEPKSPDGRLLLMERDPTRVTTALLFQYAARFCAARRTRRAVVAVLGDGTEPRIVLQPLAAPPPEKALDNVDSDEESDSDDALSRVQVIWVPTAAHVLAMAADLGTGNEETALLLDATAAGAWADGTVFGSIDALLRTLVALETTLGLPSATAGPPRLVVAVPGNVQHAVALRFGASRLATVSGPERPPGAGPEAKTVSGWEPVRVAPILERWFPASGEIYADRDGFVLELAGATARFSVSYASVGPGSFEMPVELQCK